MSGWLPDLRNTVLGIARLARFRAEGLALFDASPQGFLSSLAPILAFWLVGSTFILAEEGFPGGLADTLLSLSFLLAPAVISEALTRVMGCRDGWLRYAVAMNWCQWIFPVAFVCAAIVSAVLMAAGAPGDAAAGGAIGAVGIYALVLNWFIALHALRLPRLRAAVFVLGVNLGSAALVLVPGLISAALRGHPA
jgi:hypothetical protein